MRGPSGWVKVLALVLIALLIGGVAYSIGLSAGQSQAVVPATTGTGTVVVPVQAWGWGWGWGFPFFPLFGILFFFLLIGLLFRAFRPRPWGWNGGYGPRGGYGPGGQWTPGDVPQQFQPMLENWHRQAHGQAPTSSSGPTQPPNGPTNS